MDKIYEVIDQQEAKIKNKSPLIASNQNRLSSPEVIVLLISLFSFGISQCYKEANRSLIKNGAKWFWKIIGEGHQI